MGKILFISFVVITSLVFAYTMEYDNFLLIQTNGYEITTSLKSAIFMVLILLVFVIFILQVVSLLGKTNVSKYNKRINKIELVYENYISSIEIAYYELLNNNLSVANKYLKKAEAFLSKRQLTTLMRIKSNVLSKDYDKSLELLKNIEDKKTYLQDTILLKEYIDKNDIALMQETAERIMLNRKNDYLAVTTLYKIYKDNGNWSKCLELLKIMKNEKFLSKNDVKFETQLIGFNLNPNVKQHKGLYKFFTKIKNIFGFKIGLRSSDG